ncbi:MAG: aminotransferase class I/II-fold pyridoxal phosphate-dependent enzyme [Tepidisphaeraceae bacterium]
MSEFDSFARAYLDRRVEAALLRERRTVEPIDATRVRIDGRELIQFCANDYLGMAAHPVVSAALAGDRAGSGAAPLISGRTADHAHAEQALADWKGVESSVLLPSGYQANLAALQTCAAILESAGKRPRFLLDKLAHASLIDAGADSRRRATASASSRTTTCQNSPACSTKRRPTRLTSW